VAGGSGPRPEPHPGQGGRSPLAGQARRGLTAAREHAEKGGNGGNPPPPSGLRRAGRQTAKTAQPSTPARRGRARRERREWGEPSSALRATAGRQANGENGTAFTAEIAAGHGRGRSPAREHAEDGGDRGKGGGKRHGLQPRRAGAENAEGDSGNRDLGTRPLDHAPRREPLGRTRAALRFSKGGTRRPERETTATRRRPGAPGLGRAGGSGVPGTALLRPRPRVFFKSPPPVADLAGYGILYP